MEALLGLSVLLVVATVKVFPVLWRPRVQPLDPPTAEPAPPGPSSPGVCWGLGRLFFGWAAVRTRTCTLPSLQSFEGQVGGASLTSPLVKSPPTLPCPPWDQGCWALATPEILEAFRGVLTRLRMQS